MRITYSCPECGAALNAKQNIILAAHVAGDKNNKGLVLLHEELGNYTVALTSSLKVDSGGVVEFFCPVCQANLKSSKGENMAEFIRTDETGEESTIYISRIYGDRCTFQVDDKKQLTSYGKSVQRFMDPDWFK
jgi:predicted RNA-binding Zn-ribbon protein involved in translation (DUF1610 family)